ncbi:MAG: flagellar basal body P-ring formation protein FlgA [Candidatus Brocadiaceae bacterium]|nr:flagellar basal body P-ring formation protein FlgA [Candidatus Brocadiaceae bacterium]
MKTRTILFIAINMFILMPNILAEKIEIELFDRVTLNEKTVTFGDVSTVTGGDAYLVNKINKIEIGSTPWPNNVRKIGVDFMKMRLKFSNVKISDVVFKNTKPVEVSVETAKITGVEIAQIAKEYLLSVLPTADRETTIELVRFPVDQWVPRKRSDVYIDIALVDSSKDRGNIDLIVNATSNSISLFKVPVNFKVRVFEYVAISKKRIGRHRILTRENIFMDKRETTRIRGIAFSSMSDLTGKMTTMVIQPNTILTEGNIEVPPTVTKGSLVKVFINAKGFKIVTKGLAQQTGYTGEVIKIKNLDSRKILYGKIIDSEKVQIVF